MVKLIAVPPPVITIIKPFTLNRVAAVSEDIFPKAPEVAYPIWIEKINQNHHSLQTYTLDHGQMRRIGSVRFFNDGESDRILATNYYLSFPRSPGHSMGQFEKGKIPVL
jgi:hypothetical protein